MSGSIDARLKKLEGGPTKRPILPCPVCKPWNTAWFDRSDPEDEARYLEHSAWHEQHPDGCPSCHYKPHVTCLIINHVDSRGEPLYATWGKVSTSESNEA